MPVNLKSVAQASAADDDMIALKEAIENCWTSQTDRKSYRINYSFKDELTIKHEGDLFIVCKGDTIVVPSALRLKLLSEAHQGHLGMNKTKNLVRSIWYWPGMSDDIQKFISKYDACNQMGRSDTAPITPVADKETSAWNAPQCDFTCPSESTDGRVLLTIVDLLSRYPFAILIPDASSRNVAMQLRKLFATFGMPKRIISDNGRSFKSAEFAEFLTRCNVKHNFAAVYYPQTNGAVERFHSSLKSRMSRIELSHPSSSFDERLQRALYDIRSTPSESTGETPYSRLFNRKMNTTLPSLDTSTSPTCPVRNLRQRYDARKGIWKKYTINTPVWTREGSKGNFHKSGIITGVIGPSTYEVTFGNNSQSICNQRNMKFRYTGEEDPMDENLIEDLFDSREDTIPNRASESSHNTHPGHRYPRRNRERPNFLHDFIIDPR